MQEHKFIYELFHVKNELRSSSFRYKVYIRECKHCNRVESQLLNIADGENRYIPIYNLEPWLEQFTEGDNYARKLKLKALLNA